MGIFFPERLLDRILAETDIVELVSSYFPLKKAGRNFRALCPFHDEKTPSFMVNREKQMFKCFGCGKGGNAFHFLMEKERVPFQEAVATLARKANIPLPERKGDGPKRQVREEMFAASAYLSREPLLLGGLKGQDWGKAIIIFIILAGVLLVTLGFTDIIRWLCTGQ